MKIKKIDINMEIRFGERVGHGGWLIGPKLFRPEAYLVCTSSKLCEFILNQVVISKWTILRNLGVSVESDFAQ